MSLADTCGVAGVKRFYSRFHSYQRNEWIPFTLLLSFFRHTVQLFSYCQKSLSLCVRASLNIVFFLVLRWYNLTACPPLFLGATMMSQVLNFVREYVERLQEMLFVPRFSYGSGFLAW